MKNLTISAFMALLSTTSAFAHDYTAGDITVTHPMAFETAKTASVGGGYLGIQNTGSSADTLLEVRVESIARVELHLSETDANGVARMIKQEGIAVPAGETVLLEPGGLHVMFMGLNGDPFEVGEKIEATLIFEKAGALPITFNVETRSAKDHRKTDHSGHNVSN